VGDAALKAVRLVTVGKQNDPILASCAYIQHSRRLSHPGGEAERSGVIRQTLSSFLQRFPIAKGDVVCLNLPADKVLPKLISLPNVSAKKFVLLLKHELPHQVPMPLEELSWGFQKIGGDDSPAAQSRVLFLAARKNDVSERMRLCEELGLTVHILQSDAAAIHNLAVHDWIIPGDSRLSVVATIDIGAETTSLVISSPQAAWFRSLRLGGNDFTSAIAGSLQLSTQQAEDVKRDPGRVKNFRRLHAALVPVFEQLNNEIQRSLESYRKERAGDSPGCVIAVGEGARVNGLLRYFIFGR
jgi:type IV pilus assembly protein PilM